MEKGKEKRKGVRPCPVSLRGETRFTLLTSWLLFLLSFASPLPPLPSSLPLLSFQVLLHTTFGDVDIELWSKVVVVNGYGCGLLVAVGDGSMREWKIIKNRFKGE
jgi:hypothetical protein